MQRVPYSNFVVFIDENILSDEFKDLYINLTSLEVYLKIVTELNATTVTVVKVKTLSH